MQQVALEEIASHGRGVVVANVVIRRIREVMRDSAVYTSFYVSFDLQKKMWLEDVRPLRQRLQMLWSLAVRLRLCWTISRLSSPCLRS